MNILLIYDYYAPEKLRQTFKDFLCCFGKYSNNHVYYCNYALGIPAYLKHVEFDLIIYSQFFSSQFRLNGLSYEEYLKRLAPIKHSKALKALFCQDEFIYMDRINRFIHDFGIEVVFSVAEPSEWKTIYYDVDPQKVHFYKNLTGYLDQDIQKVMSQLRISIPSRSIDIGYRSTHVPEWLGRQGKLKVEIAKVVKDAAQKKGLKVDIETVKNNRDFFVGYDWYRFLLKCKAVIGVEGGSSIFDKDGQIRKRVEDYVKNHPEATFEEIESSCFPNTDGNLNLVALSPRHLEACAAKCCQILVEGAYSGILRPGIHYIELKRDFSNLNEVLDLVNREEVRQEITERAYQDIVESGLYTYESFVKSTEECLFSLKPCRPVKTKKSVLLKFNQFRDWLIGKMIPWEFYLFKKIKSWLPKQLIEHLKTLRNRG